jgi:hypothetical protein
VSIVTAGLDPQASNPVTTTANNPSFIYSNQWGALPNFTFTVSGVTVQPNLGATYANNGQTFTVLATNAGIVVCSATGYPQTSGTLTRLTGTGDATITFSAYTLLGSQLPFQALVNGIVITALPSNAGTAYIGPPGVTTQSTGYPLFPGQSISYACTNLNLIYAIISVVGDKLAFTGN